MIRILEIFISVFSVSLLEEVDGGYFNSLMMFWEFVLLKIISVLLFIFLLIKFFEIVDMLLLWLIFVIVIDSLLFLIKLMFGMGKLINLFSSWVRFLFVCFMVILIILWYVFNWFFLFIWCLVKMVFELLLFCVFCKFVLEECVLLL